MANKRQGPQKLSWLRVAREARGYTQAYTADQARISQVHLSRLENGRRERPHQDTAQRLADTLGVDERLLFPPSDARTPLDVLGEYLDQQNGRLRKRGSAKQ